MNFYGIGFATDRADVWSMPENYKGQNRVLRATLEDWMFADDQNVMPYRVTDVVVLEWGFDREITDCDQDAA